MSESVLDAIMSGARKAALERAKARPRLRIQSDVASPRPGAFRAAITGAGSRVIAECKRRSPSRGILRQDYDPAAIAPGYQEAGAAAISVLTESAFFDGHIDHLRAVRQAVDLPILRKDFICTEFQVLEARAAGADAVLLIVAGLSDVELCGGIANAAAHGLEALVEVHNADELKRALDCGATIIGVNCRDLRTLSVSPAIFDEVAAAIPETYPAVAESGISQPSDLARLRGLGYDAFLIGERFMSAPDPGMALSRFLAGPPEAAS